MTRGERREQKREKRRRRMPKHGATLGKVYRDVALRRLDNSDTLKV